MIVMVEDKILKQIKELLKEDLPNFYIDTWVQVNGKTINATIDDFSLKGSDYSFDYPKKRLLHFTNLDSAKKILTSEHLRASSLDSFKDKFELSHALSMIGKQNSEIWD